MKIEKNRKNTKIKPKKVLNLVNIILSKAQKT